jgi:hypothetical protein
MSTVRSLVTGFVGYGNGLELQLEAGQEFDDAHALVQARPDLFTPPEKPAATTKRRRSMDGAEEA